MEKEEPNDEWIAFKLYDEVNEKGMYKNNEMLTKEQLDEWKKIEDYEKAEEFFYKCKKENMTDAYRKMLEYGIGDNWDIDD